MASDNGPARGRIGEGAHTYPVRVYYEDTDAGGIVYHARYLHFAERARSEMLRCLGITNRDIAFAVVDCEIAYRRPARLDDALEVRTRPVAFAGATLTLRQEILRSGELLTGMRVRVAALGPSGRPRRLPVRLCQGLAILMA